MEEQLRLSAMSLAKSNATFKVPRRNLVDFAQRLRLGAVGLHQRLYCAAFGHRRHAPCGHRPAVVGHGFHELLFAFGRQQTLCSRCGHDHRPLVLASVK